MADGFLFSAGTDTQIIAYEAVKYKPDIPCLTLAFKHGNPKDTEYVKKMVELLHLKQETYQFGKEDVLKYYPKVVEALKKFDPMEIRNSLPVYIGLTSLKPKGIKSAFTGDALDELFGYPWQFHLTETEFAKKQEEMWAEMGFSSVPMAEVSWNGNQSTIHGPRVHDLGNETTYQIQDKHVQRRKIQQMDTSQSLRRRNT